MATKQLRLVDDMFSIMLIRLQELCNEVLYGVQCFILFHFIANGRTALVIMFQYLDRNENFTHT